MKNHTACKTLTLASSEFCTINQCPDCDMYHLHIGPVSIRLRSDVFDNICETLLNVYQHKYARGESNSQSLRSH